MTHLVDALIDALLAGCWWPWGIAMCAPVLAWTIWDELRGYRLRKQMGGGRG